MGGLVSREYIKNYGGKEKVYKLITIGTPNHGIYGGVANWCGTTQKYLNFKYPPECEDMKAESNFLKQLNSGQEVLVPTLSIIGASSDNIFGGVVDKTLNFTHDEVVRSYSAKINGATNVELIGSCVGSSQCDWSDKETIHGNLPDDERVYSEVLKFIKS